MTDTTEGDIIEHETDLGEPMRSRPTKRDLIERGLGAVQLRDATQVQINFQNGGLSFRDMAQVMDFAQAMATSGKLVPAFLRGNPGGCLGITFQAIHWRMDPFQVANKSYEVNDRIGFESQLIHAVIESRAPIQHRLDCRYEGEGEERRCIVIGMFVTGDVREYESPPLRKVKKKSPLWTEDPDQQLFYYSSRSWARKWCPDVLMGVYAREELVENPLAGKEEGDAVTGLHARLLGSPRSQDGHKPDHIEAELGQLDGNTTGDAQARAAQNSSKEQSEGRDSAQEAKRASEAPEGNAGGSLQAYIDRALFWIKQSTSADDLKKRWSDERKLRNALGMTVEDREPLEKAMASQIEYLKTAEKPARKRKGK